MSKSVKKTVIDKYDQLVLNNPVSKFIINNYLFSQLALLTGGFIAILIAGLTL
jgi:hypothetical protein